MIKKNFFYRERDCIKRFCSDLRELATNIVNYEQKEMIPLTDNENRYDKEQKKCYICQKEFCYDKMKKRNLNYTIKLEIILIIRDNLEELLIAFTIQIIKYPKKFL